MGGKEGQQDCLGPTRLSSFAFTVLACVRLDKRVGERDAVHCSVVLGTAGNKGASADLALGKLEHSQKGDPTARVIKRKRDDQGEKKKIGSAL